MIHDMSFRARITWLSVSLSGLILVVFGLYFIGVLHRIGLSRVDAEIVAFAEAQLRVPHPPEYWDHLDESLRYIYGEDADQRLAAQVRDEWGRTLYRSANWPAGLQLTWPEPVPVTPPGDNREWRPQRGPPPHDFAEGDYGPAGRHGPPDGPGQRALRRPPSPQRRAPPILESPELRTIESANGRSRVCRAGNQYVDLAVALDLTMLESELGRFRRAFLIAMPVALVLLALGGRYLAHRALRPVLSVTRTAEQISGRDLSQRVPPEPGASEFSGLVEVINQMLERLERSFHQAVRFSSDAAHELKSPLTVLQGELEHALQAADDGSEQQQTFNALLEEVHRLKAITQKLLLLSRADAGQLPLEKNPLDFSLLVVEAGEDIEDMAPGIRVERDIAPGVQVAADPDLLRQLMQNLISNAVNYNRRGGWIGLNMARNGTSACLSVSNTADGLAAIQLDKLFERFYRADPSRSRDAGGSGLGLSLAREIARMHSGDLKARIVGADTICFELTLPMSAE